jgi:hypothetical protein
MRQQPRLVISWIPSAHLETQATGYARPAIRKKGRRQRVSTRRGQAGIWHSIVTQLPHTTLRFPLTLIRPGLASRNCDKKTKAEPPMIRASRKRACLVGKPQTCRVVDKQVSTGEQGQISKYFPLNTISVLVKKCVDFKIVTRFVNMRASTPPSPICEYACEHAPISEPLPSRYSKSVAGATPSTGIDSPGYED